MLHRVERGDALAVRRMRRANERQVVERIHLFFGEWKRRRVEEDRLVAMWLQDRAAVVRVRLVLKSAAHLRERFAMLLLLPRHLFVRRKDDELLVRDETALVGEEPYPCAPVLLHVRRAANVGEVGDLFARRKTSRDVPRGTLAHSEDEQVRLRV